MNIDKTLDRADLARKAMERADEAKRVMDMPIVREALDAMRNGATRAISDADVNDTKRLQSLALTLQGINAFERVMHAYMSEHAMGERELNKVEKQLRPARPWQRFFSDVKETS